MFLSSAAPFRAADGTIAGAIAVFRDITALRLFHNLEERLIGHVSHELRTPVTTLKGGVRTLLTRRDRLDIETQNELLRDMANEAERLALLIENIVNLAKLQIGVRLHSEPILLRQAFERAITQIRAGESDREFILDVTPGIGPVEADALRLEHVLRNLLSNACRYSERNAPVRLSATRHDHSIEIVVTDQGPGVPEDERASIFEPFYHGAHARQGSAGLGLTVVQRLVGAMGGDVWVTSPEQGGAAFHFTLPTAEVEEVEA